MGRHSSFSVGWQTLKQPGIVEVLVETVLEDCSALDLENNWSGERLSNSWDL